MKQPANDRTVAVYLERPTQENLMAAVNAHEKVIDGIVHNLIGSSSSVARRRAYLMAAKALKTYDPSTGVPFKKYLASQLQPIRRIGRRIHEPISIPERHRRYQALLAQAREELYDELDREPSVEELANRTGITVRQQQRLQTLARNIMPVSGFEQATATEEDPAGMLPAVDVYDEQKEWEDYVYHDLDDVDRQIFDARRKGLVSNNELAQSLNLTPGAVSQRAAKIESRIAKGPYT